MSIPDDNSFVYERLLKEIDSINNTEIRQIRWNESVALGSIQSKMMAYFKKLNEGNGHVAKGMRRCFPDGIKAVEIKNIRASIKEYSSLERDRQQFVMRMIERLKEMYPKGGSNFLQYQILKYYKNPVIAASFKNYGALKTILRDQTIEKEVLGALCFNLSNHFGLEMIKLVVQHPNFTLPIPSYPFLNKRIMMNAIVNNDHDMIEYFLNLDTKKVEDIVVSGKRKRDQDTVEEMMIRACRDGDATLIEHLLESEIDLNFRDVWQLSALDYAIIGNNQECIELIKQSSSINQNTLNSAELIEGFLGPEREDLNRIFTHRDLSFREPFPE